ncbi:P27 family phage terminase small subunit [Teichococcus vastitatis]|uniref:P27 family phage terminase small subunit n=1 Tax=Teichococcus vastitatis TaxID=2307076 RepID=A0ABS9W2Z9_9PROT|nr:P27 family phage terminase small subunit [Pseudoroseomonas vastitatis]MCI0753551.1 P27 family phage terminase small subunit [Pseudoroseomonas vastitatis]
MPRSGPKPIPTRLHQLRGSFNATRHGRDRAGEPEAEGELGAAAPEWMSPGQQESWAYALAHAPQGILRAIDRGVLAIWVEAEDRHRTAVQQQARLDAGSSLPLMTRGKDGQPIASPYLRIIRQAAETMLRAAGELGFSPASRPRLAPGRAEEPASESPWTRLKLIHGRQDAS